MSLEDIVKRNKSLLAVGVTAATAAALWSSLAGPDVSEKPVGIDDIDPRNAPKVGTNRKVVSEPEYLKAINGIAEQLNLSLRLVCEGVLGDSGNSQQTPHIRTQKLEEAANILRDLRVEIEDWNYRFADTFPVADSDGKVVLTDPVWGSDSGNSITGKGISGITMDLMRRYAGVEILYPSASVPQVSSGFNGVSWIFKGVDGSEISSKDQAPTNAVRVAVVRALGKDLESRIEGLGKGIRRLDGALPPVLDRFAQFAYVARVQVEQVRGLAASIDSSPTSHN